MQLKASRLGEMLLEAGLIDQFQLESALSLQRNLGGRIGSALIRLGYLPEATILEFLESQSKYNRVQLTDLEIPQELIRLLPASRLQHLLVIPIELRRSGQESLLQVAMTDPTNLELVEELQVATGCRIMPVFAGEDEIRQTLRKYLPGETPAEGIDTAGNALSEAGLKDGLVGAELQLDRLLEILKEKGVLSAHEIERVKFG